MYTANNTVEMLYTVLYYGVRATPFPVVFILILSRLKFVQEYLPPFQW